MSKINPDDNDILKAAMGDLEDEEGDTPKINKPLPTSQRRSKPSDEDVLKIARTDFEEDKSDALPAKSKAPHLEVLSSSSRKKRVGALVAVFIIAIVGISAFVLVEKQNKDFTTSKPNNQTEQEIAVMQSVDNGFSEIESKYLVNGYVPISQLENVINEEFEYANSLVNKGVAKTAKTENLCVYVEFESEDICMYSPKIEGLLNVGESNQIITLEPFYGELTNGEADKAALRIERNNSNYKFTDNFDKSSVTLESIEQMKGASVIIWSGHGNYTKDTHSVLLTCESAYSAKRWLDSGNRKKGDRIIDCSGFLAICPSFIDNHFDNNDFKDTVIYLGACCSAKDDYLLNVLKLKGASAVYGATNYISSDYCNEMMNSLFGYISKGHSVKSALAKAKEDCGATDDRLGGFISDLSEGKKFSVFFNPAKIILVANDDSFKLKPEENLDDIPAVDHPEDIGENDSFVDKLCADEWYIVQEGDFTYFTFNDDGTVTITSYVPEEKSINVQYDVIDDETVYFGFKNVAGVTRITLTNRIERDMVDIEIVEFGETITGTMEWKSNLE